MKKEKLIWLGLGCGVILIFYLAYHFKEMQEMTLLGLSQERKELQRNIKDREGDLLYLKNSQLEMDYLENKKWFVPENRLTAGDFLTHYGQSLRRLHVTFEPEQIQNLEVDYVFKVTKLVLKVEALFDQDIYVFIAHLLEKFPGILSFREITLSRLQEIDGAYLSALKANKAPSFIVGHMSLEWVAIGEDPHAK